MGSHAAAASIVTALHGGLPNRDIPRAAHSRFVQRIRRRYAGELALVAARPAGPDDDRAR